MLPPRTLRWLFWPDRQSLLHDLKSPKRAQDKLLHQLIGKLAQTEYGKLFLVKSSDNYESFKQKVPVVTPDQLRHWILRQRDSSRAILTSDTIVAYETTSDSSGEYQFVPCTAALKQSFARAAKITMTDKLTHAGHDDGERSDGLSSTYAPLTVYLGDARACVPLIAEVFFEFLADDGTISRIHELVAGQSYELIISQQSGLMRYRLGERVTVPSKFLGTPCLESAGRADRIIDMVGEKLGELFAKACLEEVIGHGAASCKLEPRMGNGQKPHYCLVTTFKHPDPQAISRQLDEALSKAFHYRHARRLGHLGEVTVQVA